MSDKLLPLSDLQTPSTFSLEDLQELSQTTTPTKTISSTQLTKVHTSRELRGPDGAKMRTGKIKAALEGFEASAGGRDALIDSLSIVSLDKKQQHFLNLIADPARCNDTLATIARDAGLLPTQVLDLFRSATFAKSHAIAMGKLDSSLPNIVDDMIGKSVDAEVICPECFGEMMVNESVCDRCKGRGTVYRASSIDSQKVVLEATGVLKKGGGVNVQVQQNVGTMQPGSYFSKYVKASDQAAYDISVADAEVIKDNEGI